MGQVFVRIFLVSLRVMRAVFMGVIFVGLLAGLCVRRRSGGRLDGSRIRQRHRRQRLTRVDMAIFVMGVIVVGMIVLVVRMFVIMRLRRIVPVMSMMFGIVMFGVMMLVGIEMPLFAVDMIMRLMPMFVRLVGLGAIRARAFDHLAANAVAIAATARIAVTRAAAVGAVFALFFGLAMGAFVGFDQRLPVGDRNLIIIRMDFAEGQKTVTVAAVLDEGRLQRWLYARDLGEIDIAAQLFALGGLEIKLFDAVAADHDDPGLFRVGSIDQHFVGHFGTHDGGGRVFP
jgi:hypothetical protein